MSKMVLGVCIVVNRPGHGSSWFKDVLYSSSFTMITQYSVLRKMCHVHTPTIATFYKMVVLSISSLLHILFLLRCKIMLSVTVNFFLIGLHHNCKIKKFLMRTLPNTFCWSSFCNLYHPNSEITEKY